MIVDPSKHRDPIEYEFASMPYMPVMLSLPAMPETTPCHHCDKRDKKFDYKKSLNDHIEDDHLTKNTKMGFFSSFKYFGHPKGKGPKLVEGPIEELIVDNNKLKTVFINANSIISPYKRSTTKLGIQESKAHVVIIAESKLGKKHTEFKVRGYHTVANLIRKSNAGGLVVMAKDTILLHSVSMKNILPEIQFISFKFGDVTFFTVYRSPSYGITDRKTHHQKLIDHLDGEIDKVEASGSRYIIAGDFNLSTLAKNNFEPAGSWVPATDSKIETNDKASNACTDQASQGQDPSHDAATDACTDQASQGQDSIHEAAAGVKQAKADKKTKKAKKKARRKAGQNLTSTPDPDDKDDSTIDQIWHDFVHRRSLDQWVEEPTFHRYNSVTQVYTETMTDLVLSPPSMPIHQIKVDKDLFQGRFDHYAVVFVVDLNFKTNETPRVRRLHKKENWQKFYNLLLSYKLFDTCPRDSVDTMANYITAKIMEAYNEACPLVEAKQPPPGGHFHRETKSFLKRTTRLRATLKLLTPCTPEHNNLWMKLKILQKCVDAMVKNDLVQNQIKLLERARHDHTNLYAHIKQAKSKSSIVGPIVNMDGELCSSDQGITDSFSNLLGDQLKRTYNPYTKPVNWKQVHREGPSEPDCVDSLYVTPTMVKYHITKSRRGSAAGPDGVPMEAIAVASDILVEPLAALYNMINESTKVPKCFRTARVKMLYKKGEKSDMLNYRPLSMSNHIGKIWERLVNDKLISHLEKNKLLSNNQHGFRPFRGTTTNLIRLWEIIMGKVEADGGLVELWNYDLQKAFDKLDHPKVLELLHKSGVRGRLGKTIQNWLTTRTQTVEVGTSKSEEREVGRSCCQGSVLGPSLWLLYIQSLTTILDSMGVEYMAYADDISIVQRMSTKEDKEKFERVLEVLQEWADEYNMKWSPLKTQRIVFKYQHCREAHDPFEMYFGGKIVKPLDSTCVSLGVIFDKNLTFTSQIRKVCNQIRALTSLIRQEVSNITPSLLRKYYQVYVLPALTYCSQVWHPGNEAQLRDVEKAVKSFWRLSKYGPPQDHIPPRLLLIILDLNYVKKLKDGNHVLDFDEIFETEKYRTDRIDEEDKLPTIRKNLNVSRTKFSYRARAYWNLIPKDIRSLTYSGFKSRARAYVMDHAREFLNIGNKDKEIPHKIFEPHVGCSDGKTSKEPTMDGKSIIKVQIKELRKKYKNTFTNLSGSTECVRTERTKDMQ